MKGKLFISLGIIIFVWVICLGADFYFGGGGFYGVEFFDDAVLFILVLLFIIIFPLIFGSINKKFSYTRSGVIAGIITILLESIFFIILDFKFIKDIIYPHSYEFFTCSGFGGTVPCGFGTWIIGKLIIIIILTFLALIIGALIGFIIGKIKSRNQILIQ